MEDKNVLSMEDVEISNKPRAGQIVTGTVVDVKDDVVYLDLHTFTEGVIYLDHYTYDKGITSFVGLVNVGDEMKVEITKVEEGDESGAILCSRLKLLKEEKFNEIVKLFEEQTPFTVKVDKVVEGKGFNVSYAGFRFFMPRSLALREVNIGDKVEVRLTKVDERSKSGIVDARTLHDEKVAALKEEEYNKLNEGDVVTGEVVKILPFACIVKFNDLQGILRLPEISHTFIEKIEDVLNVGDKVEVKIIGLKNGKIALSRKALLPTPFEEYASLHKKGETIKATVISKLPYGLLLEVAPNVKGLLHQSEYSWNPNDNFNSCVNIGDEVEVAIIELDVENNRISLSRKALIDNPWSRVDAKVGDVCECKIKAFEPKGVLVETLGVDGFIPTPAFLGEDQNGKPDDYYAVGDVVKAAITEIRPKEWTLRLSVRRILQQEERKQFEKYMNQEESDSNVTIGDMFKDILK